MATKIRRDYENYLDNYWETTFEHTAIHNEKFRGTLKVVRDFIKDNENELDSIKITKDEFTKLYVKLQILLRVNFPTKGQTETTIEEFTKKIKNKGRKITKRTNFPKKNDQWVCEIRIHKT